MSAPGPAGAAAAGHRDFTGASIYGLTFLTLISTLNYFDRSVLSLVLPLIKKDMGLSDTTLGDISSLVAVYALVGVPVASLADRWSRRNVVAIGFAFWSAMTALTGFSTGAWHLAGTRLLMAVGESCGVAPSNSMMSDMFSKDRLPVALAIFTCASSIAAIVYSPAAGYIADHYGWRPVFFISGAIGLCLAPIFFFTVREPRRGAASGDAASLAEQRPAFGVAMKFLIGSRTFVLMVLGGAFMGAYLYGTGAWGTTFLVRVHHLSITEIGAVFGPVRGVVGAVGIILGGLIANWLSRRDERWRGWIPGLACLILAVFEAVFLFADQTWLWVSGLVGSSLFGIMSQPAVYAALMAVAKPRMRALSVSINLLFATVAGQILGPSLIGRLNDALAPRFGDMAIRYSMSVLILCSILGGLCFFAAGWFVERDMRRAAQV